MKKLAFLILLSLAFIFPRNVHAENNFDIAVESTYNISQSGNTNITQKTRITNKTDYFFSPSYSINLNLKDIRNVRVYDTGGAIPFKVNTSGDGKKVDITFKKKSTGINKVNEFYFSFESLDIAKKFGSVWEINIPGVSNPDEFSKYDTYLNIPANFGQPSIVKPNKALSGNNNFYFSKNDIGSGGIYIVFGDKQYYFFNLDYHLSNPNLFPIKTEIALPPSTNYQDVIIDSLIPKPVNVYRDYDGNWLAVYSLLPQKKLDIQAKGFIRLGINHREEQLTTEERLEYLKPNVYWESTDTKIKSIAKDLQTPLSIYNYVVNTLSYDYDKILGENQRLGAKKALSDPKSSVCLEFTDLFVALSRAKGIPAREVNGFAYTENSKLKPLSLVKDVLHAWPEYYDDSTKSWVMIDPTWGNTTKGIDYFNNLDFEHVAFVIKGKDSKYPIPAGGYKYNPNSKDVSISFSQEDKFRQSYSSDIKVSLPSFALSGMPINATIIVYNTGNSEITDKKLYLSSNIDNKTYEFFISSLPPYGNLTFTQNFEKTSLLTNNSFKVKILFEGKTIEKDVKIGILPEIFIYIIGGVLIAAAIIISVITIKTRRLPIQKQQE